MLSLSRMPLTTWTLISYLLPLLWRNFTQGHISSIDQLRVVFMSGQPGHASSCHPIKSLAILFFSASLTLSSTMSSTFSCNACKCHKSNKLPFSISSLHSSAPLELICFIPCKCRRMFKEGTHFYYGYELTHTHTHTHIYIYI